MRNIEAMIAIIETSFMILIGLTVLIFTIVLLVKLFKRIQNVHIRKVQR